MSLIVKNVEPMQNFPDQRIGCNSKEFKEEFDEAAKIFANVTENGEHDAIESAHAISKRRTGRALERDSAHDPRRDSCTNRLADLLERAQELRMLSPAAQIAYERWKQSGNKSDLYRALRLHRENVQVNLEHAARAEFEKMTVRKTPSVQPNANRRTA